LVVLSYWKVFPQKKTICVNGKTTEKTMNNTIIAIVVFLSLLVGQTVLQAQTPPVIYVANDGSGDFNCDGNQDQIEINQALDLVASNPDYTTVFLKGPSAYLIDDSIIISSNTIFSGDSTAIIQLIDNAGWWTHSKPIVGQKNRVEWNPWGNEGDRIENVEIYGFEISGGEQAEPSGDTYIPLIHFYNPSNVSIHNMNLHDSYWDIVRLSSHEEGTPVHSAVYNNSISYSGHEGICFVNVTDFEAYNNTIYSTRTNTGIRAKDTDSLSIHHNIIGNSLAKNPSGYVGILVENQSWPLEHAEIFNNVIYGKNGGIHLGGNVGTYPTGYLKNAHIHHNIIFKIRDAATSEGFIMDGGIKVNGYSNSIIEHNIIESGTSDGIVYEGTSGGGAGYQTIVRNNIIIGNGGYGIHNKETAIHTFLSNNNLVYNNSSGNYQNTTSINDVISDPAYATSHSTLNKWHHIASTYDNSTETFTIYVNGKEQAKRHFAGFGSIGLNDQDLFLGGYRGAAYWFKGRQDEMAIWDRALPADVIHSIYNNGVPINIEGELAQGLQAYFKMENDWSDDNNTFNPIDSTATFTTDTIAGDHAGLFNGSDNYVEYPDSLSTTSGLTLSVWVFRNPTGEEDQTILNKGRQEDNNHIWLYFSRDSLIFELGNGTKRFSLEANIVNPWDMDFHVKSQAGRWAGDEWVKDTETSPCVDSGALASEYVNEPSPNGHLVNIGVYGNTAEASKSFNKSSIFNLIGPYIWIPATRNKSIKNNAR
jgi:hypothetical protein